MEAVEPISIGEEGHRNTAYIGYVDAAVLIPLHLGAVGAHMGQSGLVQHVQQLGHIPGTDGQTTGIVGGAHTDLGGNRLADLGLDAAAQHSFGLIQIGQLLRA